METLTGKTCVSCDKISGALEQSKVDELMKEVPEWKQEGKKINREFKFHNFVESVGFVNKVAIVAESEGHHPDIHIHWDKVLVELWTHSIDGLSENDFIVAAKIDAFNDKNAENSKNSNNNNNNE